MRSRFPMRSVDTLMFMFNSMPMVMSVATGITIGILLNMYMRVSTDLIGNLDLIRNANSPGDLAFVLHWPLGTLSVLLVNALRTSGVSRLSFTLTITIPSTSMRNYLGIMANNSRTAVDLLRCFLTMSSDDVLTILNISSIYNNIIFLMASLFIGNVVLGVAMLLLVAIGKVSTTRSTLGKGCKGKDSDNSEHD